MRLLSALLTSAVALPLILASLAAKPGSKPRGVHKIEHVVVIMQENRSFDEYFGTYRGADGIPAGVCVPDPANGGCVKPYHDPTDRHPGGPHAEANAIPDIDGGKMDGFVREAEFGRKACRFTKGPPCGGVRSKDAMGYKTAHDIPNYWAYAKQFVLQDHKFESARSWSLPSHLFMVSGWSAQCSRPTDPSTCRTDLDHPDLDRSRTPATAGPN